MKVNHDDATSANNDTNIQSKTETLKHDAAKQSEKSKKINIQQPQMKGDAGIGDIHDRENSTRSDRRRKISGELEEEPVLELHPQFDDSVSLSPMKFRTQKDTKIENQTHPETCTPSEAAILEVQSPDREISSPEREELTSEPVKVIQTEIQEERHGPNDIQRYVTENWKPSRDFQTQREIKTQTKAAQAQTKIQRPPKDFPSSRKIERPPRADQLQIKIQKPLRDIQSPSRDIQSPDGVHSTNIGQTVPVKVIHTEMETVPTKESSEETKPDNKETEKQKAENDKEKLKKMAKLLGTKAVEQGERAGMEPKLEVNVVSQILQKPIAISEHRTVKPPSTEGSKMSSIGKGEERKAAEEQVTGKGEERKPMKEQVVVGNKRTVLLRRPDVREFVDSPKESLFDESEHTETTEILTRKVIAEDEKNVHKPKRNKADFMKGAAGVFAKALKDVGKAELAKATDYDDMSIEVTGHEERIVKKGSDTSKTSVDSNISRSQEIKQAASKDKTPIVPSLQGTCTAASTVEQGQNQTAVSKPFLFPIIAPSNVSGQKPESSNEATEVEVPAPSNKKADTKPDTATEQTGATGPKKIQIQRKWGATNTDSNIEADAMGGGDNETTSKIKSEKSDKKQSEILKDIKEEGEIPERTDDELFDAIIQERVRSELESKKKIEQGEKPYDVVDEVISVTSDSALNSAEKKKKKKHKKEKKHKKDKKKKKKKHKGSDSGSSPERKKYAVSDSEDISPVKKSKYCSESDDKSPEKHKSRKIL